MLKHAFESQSLLGLVYKIVSETYASRHGHLELQVLGSKAKEPIPAQYSQELRSLLDDILEKSSTTPGLKLLPSW